MLHGEIHGGLFSDLFNVIAVKRPNKWLPQFWHSMPPKAQVKKTLRSAIRRETAEAIIMGFNHASLVNGGTLWAVLLPVEIAANFRETISFEDMAPKMRGGHKKGTKNPKNSVPGDRIETQKHAKTPRKTAFHGRKK